MTRIIIVLMTLFISNVSFATPTGFCEGLKNIKSANVSNMSTTVKNGKISQFRVNVKIVFELD